VFVILSIVACIFKHFSLRVGIKLMRNKKKGKKRRSGFCRLLLFRGKPSRAKVQRFLGVPRLAFYAQFWIRSNLSSVLSV